MINKNRMNNFRLVKPAGMFNLIHGGLATLYYLIFLMDFFHILDINKATEDNVVYNLYMVFQLAIVIFGVVAAVYSIRARQPEKQYLYYGAFSIAGLSSTFLFLMGQMTICCIINVIAGIIMIRDANNADAVKNSGYAFGGSSKGLSNEKSTASIVDNIKK